LDKKREEGKKVEELEEQRKKGTGEGKSIKE